MAICREFYFPSSDGSSRIHAVEWTPESGEIIGVLQIAHGVAEYGITVRWDKNYLKVLRLLLERRAAFSMFGGVRFGGTLTMEDAWALGFDHVALCMGAGKPTIIDMENGLARGVRQASDFLMALQLTGAARRISRKMSPSFACSRARAVSTASSPTDISTT